MSDDKEERRYWPITKDDYEGIRNGETWAGLIIGRWGSLPLVPKHTDKEVEGLNNRIANQIDHIALLEARIKELEATLETMEEEMVIDTKSLIELGGTFQHCGKEIERLRERIKELEDTLKFRCLSCELYTTIDKLKARIKELEARIKDFEDAEKHLDDWNGEARK